MRLKKYLDFNGAAKLTGCAKNDFLVYIAVAAPRDAKKKLSNPKYSGGGGQLNRTALILFLINPSLSALQFPVNLQPQVGAKPPNENIGCIYLQLLENNGEQADKYLTG